MTFERERVTGDGRLDLVGVDRQGRPRVIIESKIGHAITVDQLQRYHRHQTEELGPTTGGVLVLLVPYTRLPQAEATVQYLVSGMAPTATEMTVSTVPLSWEHCLSMLAEALPEDDGAVSVAADIAQLCSVCATLGATAAPPRDVPEDEREEYLRTLLRQLPNSVPTGWRTTAIRVLDRDYSVFRYFDVPDVAAAISIGVTQTFRASAATPVWARFHSATRGFDELRRCLQRSDLAEQVRQHRGHLWLPVDLGETLGGPELLDHIIDQTILILQAAGFPVDPAPGRDPNSSQVEGSSGDA